VDDHRSSWRTFELSWSGLVYLALPACARTRSAVVHFWLHNLGLPLMMGSLTAALLGRSQVEPLIGAGSVLVVAGLSVFAVNVLRNGGVGEAGAVQAGRTSREVA
jgi:hypothetical protein